MARKKTAVSVYNVSLPTPDTTSEKAKLLEYTRGVLGRANSLSYKELIEIADQLEGSAKAFKRKALYKEPPATDNVGPWYDSFDKVWRTSS